MKVHKAIDMAELYKDKTACGCIKSVEFTSLNNSKVTCKKCLAALKKGKQ